jgi:hypothetical protein
MPPWDGIEYQVVDREHCRECGEDVVLGTYMHKSRAERAIAELGLRKSKRRTSDGQLRYVVREIQVNIEL